MKPCREKNLQFQTKEQNVMISGEKSYVSLFCYSYFSAATTFGILLVVICTRSVKFMLFCYQNVISARAALYYYYLLYMLYYIAYLLFSIQLLIDIELIRLITRRLGRRLILPHFHKLIRTRSFS